MNNKRVFIFWGIIALLIFLINYFTVDEPNLLISCFFGMIFGLPLSLVIEVIFNLKEGGER